MSDTCTALGGQCEWPQTCEQRGSCAYGGKPKEAAPADLDDTFRQAVLRCRYPVCTSLNPNGHAWDTSRLNEVIADDYADRRERVSADPLPLTDTYVQPVPDKCDRITWRGQYYHLPVSSQSQPLVEPTADAKDAARYRWLRDHANDYERDGAMVILHEHDEDNKDRPHWVLCNAALDETIDSALAAPPQQHQVKKGEPS